MSARDRYGFIEPMPVMDALEMLWATIARGKPPEGPWYSPKGGYVEVRWLNRKGTYRFTLDLMPPGTKREDQ